eukprot:365902-Chlamydomonas_euryale.AAC.5
MGVSIPHTGVSIKHTGVRIEQPHTSQPHITQAHCPLTRLCTANHGHEGPCIAQLARHCRSQLPEHVTPQRPYAFAAGTDLAVQLKHLLCLVWLCAAAGRVGAGAAMNARQRGGVAAGRCGSGAVWQQCSRHL